MCPDAAVLCQLGTYVLPSRSLECHVVLEGPCAWELDGVPVPPVRLFPQAFVAAACVSCFGEELLAASDSSGSLQIWDATALRHVCRFAGAHRGPAPTARHRGQREQHRIGLWPLPRRGLSFSTQNSDLLISGGRDAALVFWDVRPPAE